MEAAWVIHAYHLRLSGCLIYQQVEYEKNWRSVHEVHMCEFHDFDFTQNKINLFFLQSERSSSLSYKLDLQT